MTNMSIQPLCLTHFIEILLVLELQLTKFIVRAFSYKAHFRPKISSNGSPIGNHGFKARARMEKTISLFGDPEVNEVMSATRINKYCKRDIF